MTIEQKVKYIPDAKAVISAFIIAMEQNHKKLVKNIVYDATKPEGIYKLQGKLRNNEDALNILENIIDKALQS